MVQKRHFAYFADAKAVAADASRDHAAFGPAQTG